MRDVVFPSGNELEFIDFAKRVGIEELVFVYRKKADFFKGSSDFKTTNALYSPVNKLSGTKGLLTVCDHSREAIERGAGIVVGAELEERRDKTHYRRSGLNQVLCKLAAKKGTAIAFSLNSLIFAGPAKRALLMGRMMQNVRLCRKYGAKMCFASFAKSPWHLRSPEELSSLAASLGVPREEVKSAVGL